MPGYIYPRKTWQYTYDSKVKEVQRHLVRDLFIGNYTVRYIIGSNEIFILRMWSEKN